jgi:hypothetical protein
MTMPQVRFETEAELREFFASFGLSSAVIERAVQARYHPPEQDLQLHPAKRKRTLTKQKPRARKRGVS